MVFIVFGNLYPYFWVIPAMANWMDEEDDDSLVLALIDEELTECEQLTALLCQYWVPFVCKEPRKTSKHTGHLWVQEVLATHNTRCHDMFRMETHMFYLLCHKLVEH